MTLAYASCLAEQVSDEILRILNLTEDILSKFGFKDHEF
jgi:threonyl-tRNA synthetase